MSKIFKGSAFTLPQSLVASPFALAIRFTLDLSRFWMSIRAFAMCLAAERVYIRNYRKKATVNSFHSSVLSLCMFKTSIQD